MTIRLIETFHVWGPIYAMGLLDTVSHITSRPFLITFNYPTCETELRGLYGNRVISKGTVKRHHFL